MLGIMIAMFRLRNAPTIEIMAAMDVLNGATTNDADLAKNIEKAKLVIGRELIRRGVVFW